MPLSIAQSALSIASGSLVGFSLGLIGGGGSILAVPLLAYVVGVSSPHIAIGTSAVAVAANAAMNLRGHARAGRVKWQCALVFSGAGIIGAFAGSTLGKLVDGQTLLALFALIMILVGWLMVRRRAAIGDEAVELTAENSRRLAAVGLATGLLSGFFGIGGGFLIVPGLIFATGMPIGHAVASSLVAVTAFGLTTSLNYAASGLVDWLAASLFIVGGFFGGTLGTRVSHTLSSQRGALNLVFAGLIFATAGYMLLHSLHVL